MGTTIYKKCDICGMIDENIGGQNHICLEGQPPIELCKYCVKLVRTFLESLKLNGGN